MGRPYSQYAKVVIKYSYLGSIIQPQGWKAWSTTDPRLDGVAFAEYENVGPGNWENNAAARLTFGNATLLTSDTYTPSEVMASTSRIDMTYWNSIVTPQPSTTTVPPTNTTGDSTSPPAGACIVSKTAITGQTTYSTIAGCINSLPSTSTLATIFIYLGTYGEQLTFNRSGVTIFQGYADTPGSYSSNQVTITNSFGVDMQTDESNSDSANFYSRGKNVKFYNLNLIVSYNPVQSFGKRRVDSALTGSAIHLRIHSELQRTMRRLVLQLATMAMLLSTAVKFLGNQDTFDVNVGTLSRHWVECRGYQLTVAGASVFAYNTYIEGSIISFGMSFGSIFHYCCVLTVKISWY